MTQEMEKGELFQQGDYNGEEEKKTQEETSEEEAIRLISLYFVECVGKITKEGEDIKGYKVALLFGQEKAFREQAEGGNFFKPFNVFEEDNNGKQIKIEFPSIFDFFKKIKEQEAAQEIINAIEKVELKQVVQDMAIAYFLDIKKNIIISDSEKKSFFDIQYNAFIKQAKEGNFFEPFNIPRIVDGKSTERKSPSVFECLQNMMQGFEKLQNSSKEEIIKKEFENKVKRIQEIINEILKIQPKEI